MDENKIIKLMKQVKMERKLFKCFKLCGYRREERNVGNINWGSLWWWIVIRTLVVMVMII